MVILTVEGSIPVERQSARVGVVVVVVELYPNVVECGVSNDDAHVGLRNGTLGCASDVVRVSGVGGEVFSQRRDHGRIVLAVSVVQFDVLYGSRQSSWFSEDDQCRIDTHLEDPIGR